MCKIKTSSVSFLTCQSIFTVARRSAGRLFHALGAAMLNARSPNLSRERIGRAFRCWWPIEMPTETCVQMPDVACLSRSPVCCRQQQSAPVDRYCTRAAIGNQCSSLNAGVTWSRDWRLQTSRTAAFMTRCNGAVVDCGNLASSTLQ